MTRICYCCQCPIIKQHKWKLITIEVRMKNVQQVVNATLLVHRHCDRPTSYHPAIGEKV